MSDFQYNDELSAAMGLVRSQSAELDRLRAEVASLTTAAERLGETSAYWAGEARELLKQLAAANVRVEQLAWATFDGEGSYDLRLYQDNENYRDEYIRINGEKYASWVIPLYVATSEADKEKTK